MVKSEKDKKLEKVAKVKSETKTKKSTVKKTISKTATKPKIAVKPITKTITKTKKEVKKNPIKPVEKKPIKYEKNTGSPEFQITELTKKINNLTEHLKSNIHDYHSRNGLLLMVGKRRGILNYLQNVEIDRYRKIIKELKIRK